jgi:hypothetical protein
MVNRTEFQTDQVTKSSVGWINKKIVVIQQPFPPKKKEKYFPCFMVLRRLMNVREKVGRPSWRPGSIVSQ